MARRAVASPDKAASVADRVNKTAPDAPHRPNPEKKSSNVTAEPAPVPEKDAPEDLLAIFGENLKAARLELGLKQSDMAQLTGISQQRLSYVESGKQNVTLRTMMHLAQVVRWDVCSMLVKAKPSR